MVVSFMIAVPCLGAAPCGRPHPCYEHHRQDPTPPPGFLERTFPGRSSAIRQHDSFAATALYYRPLPSNPKDLAPVGFLGLLGLRIFEACGASIADLGEEHGHRVLRVRGKGGKVVLVPLPPAVARAIDGAVDDRTSGPILRNALGVRMDRHAATRRLKHLAQAAGLRMSTMHPTCCATRS